MRHRVYIHTNGRQMLGAIVARHALRRNSRNAENFAVEIIHTDDHPFLLAREGQPFRRGGVNRPWRNNDLQSFTPLRFMPPELMGYEGRAVIMDPDIFAVGDIWELLTRDMEGKAIVCRLRSGPKKFLGCFASSVMLLECAKLTHWNCREMFDGLFEFRHDYMDLISLKLEPRESIGLFEDYWNDFDRLNGETRLLHNTRRITQPWKTGLPVDFTPADSFPLFPPIGWVMRWRRRLFGDHALLGRYVRHPDPKQEAMFFNLLRECLKTGQVSEEFIRSEIEKSHLRNDAFEYLDMADRQAA